MAVLALLAGWLVAGRMLRPIRTITRTARRISSASLHERLALDGPQDELKELGDTLDDLFDRLDASFEAQRQFVANASHELRAPLARQRALIQVALADPRGELRLAARSPRARARIRAAPRADDRGLLTLTRGQAGLERREQLDLAALASQALLARESELAGLDLDVRATLATAPTAGDPRLIERLIANLIDNAIRHNTPGGHVEIATGTRDRRAIRVDREHRPDRPARSRSSVCFNPSNDWTAPAPATTTDTDWDSPSSRRSPTAHDAELSAPRDPRAGSPSKSSFPPATGAVVQAVLTAATS